MRVVEDGAELIGRDHVNWLRLARRFGLPLSLINESDSYATLHLQSPLLLDRELRPDAARIFELMNDALAALNPLAAALDPYLPWNADASTALDQRTVAQWIASVLPADKKHGDLVRKVLTFQLENMQGTTIENQSLLGLLAPVAHGLKRKGAILSDPSPYWTDSEVYRCASGNGALATALASELGSETIRWGCRVTDLELQNATVTLTTADGKTAPFDFVIVATPPTCWPTGTDALVGVARPALGYAAKYQMPVRSRFWLRTHQAPTGSSDEIGLLWEGSDNQNLPPDASALLTLFLGGMPAKTISTSTDARAFVLEKLTPLYPDLPAAMAAGDYLVNWPATDFIGGGYSCPAPTNVCTTVKALHDGTKHVWCAGEHVAMPFFGYMEGALYTGLRAAHKIAAVCGLEEAQAAERYRAAVRADQLRKPVIDVAPFRLPDPE